MTLFQALILCFLFTAFLGCQEDENLQNVSSTPKNDHFLLYGDTIIEVTSELNQGYRFLRVDTPSVITFTIEDYFLFDPETSYFDRFTLTPAYISDNYLQHRSYVTIKVFEEISHVDTFKVEVDTGYYHFHIESFKCRADLKITVDPFDTFLSEPEHNNDFSKTVPLEIDSIQKAYLGLYTKMFEIGEYFSNSGYEWDSVDCYSFTSSQNSVYSIIIESNNKNPIPTNSELLVADHQGNVVSTYDGTDIQDTINFVANSSITYLQLSMAYKPMSYSIMITEKK